MDDDLTYEINEADNEGTGFTPDAPGIDAVWVIASRDLATGDASEENVAASRDYARLLAAAEDMLTALRFVVERAGYGLRAADEDSNLHEAADCLSSCETEALAAIKEVTG